MIDAKQQQAVIDRATKFGSNPSNFRDAVHETVHAIQCLDGDEDWSRRRVSAEYAELEAHEQVLGECIARATEWLACEQAKIDYDMESFALITFMEGVKCGFVLDHGEWIEGIIQCKDNGQAETFLKSLLETL
jgi:hypothetical protein